MTRARTIALSCYVVALIPMYGAGVVYSSLTEFMPYHAVAVGHPWAEVEPGMQVLILATLHGAGGLVLSAALAMSILLAIPFRRGERWAYWATPLVGCCALLAGLRSALSVDLSTPADPPWQVLVGVVLLLVIALLVSLQEPKT